MAEVRILTSIGEWIY